jgi:hypothetical protein
LDVVGWISSDPTIEVHVSPAQREYRAAFCAVINKRATEDGVQHEHRRRCEQPALVRPALDLRAIVLIIMLAVFNERVSVAAASAPPQLAIDALDPLRNDHAQRQSSESQPDER